MFASLSIYGLYSYDTSIFDNLVLPSAFTDQERDDTILTILSECSDLALLYPDFDFMKMLIGVWSRNELHIWNKLLESERIEFNPIENYDRHESITRAVNSTGGETDSRSSATTGQADRSDSASKATTGQSDRSDSASKSASELSSRDEKADNSSRGNNTGSTEGVNGQTAYDSDTIKDTAKSRGISASVSATDEQRNASASEYNSQQESNTGSTQERSAVQEANTGSTSEHSAVQEAATGKRETNNQTVETVTNHTHGNIGVTQAADMLARFREVSDFCVIDFIVDSFKDRFCVQVY